MEALTTIWSTLKAYQGPLLTLAFLFGPSLYKRVLVLFHTPPDVSSPPRSRTLLLALALQAFYTIYTLLKPPYNAFAHYDLLTPTDILRPLILSDFGLDGWKSDPLVELFLARLGSVDGRIAYSRWGHVAFFGCAWCRSKADYALFALPGILGPYVAEALLLGALGWTSVGGEGARERSKKWRPTIGWAVAAMAVGEFAIRWWFDLRAREGALLHLSPLLLKARLLALLAITASYILLPVRPSPTELSHTRLVGTLDSAYNTLNLTAAARSAIARSPAMARTAAAGASYRAKAEDKARTDPAVVGAALDAGVYTRSAGGEAGHTKGSREGAGNFVRGQWARVVRRQK